MTRTFRSARHAFLALLAVLIAPGAATAGTIAIAELAPYAQKDEEGRWSGPAVDLIRTAADRAGTQVAFVEAPPARIAAGGTGAVAALPVIAGPETPPGMARSLPLTRDGVGLLGANAGGGGFLARMLGLFNWDFLRVVLVIAALLLVVGALFWLIERGRNEGVDGEDGDAGPVKGIGNGFWWAGVTATTIGYGDTVPKTVGGRSLAMVWMLFSMALTALLTAYLVSLTGGEDAGVDLAEEIDGKRVGVVAGGMVPEALLAPAGAVTPYPTLDAARDALDADAVDLVAHPYRTLQAEAGSANPTRTNGDTLLPMVLVADGEDALRREIDRVVLSPEWQERMAAESGQ